MRPPTDRARETIFNVLRPMMQGARVLDIFSGTGSFGLEALSRGAEWTTFVEVSPAARQVLRKNIEACQFTGESTVVRSDWHRFLATGNSGDAYDLIFLDPPYRLDCGDESLALLEAGDWLSLNAVVVIHHPKSNSIINLPDATELLDRRVFAEDLYSFFGSRGNPHGQSDLSGDL